MRLRWLFLGLALAGCASPMPSREETAPDGINLLIIEGSALPKVQEPRDVVFSGLTHRQTDVKARLTLFFATVTVTQQYVNAQDRAVDAVYSFPLPDDAGVRDFVLQIGDRKIRGIIRERDEARRIHREARRQGYVTTLLGRDSSTSFTHSIANIAPGARIDVRITYLHGLRYAAGMFEFVVPRMAADLTLEAIIDGEITDVTSSHPIRVDARTVTLTGHRDGDFILRYRMATRAALAVSGGYFVLVVDDGADLRIDWGTLGVSEVYPPEIPESRPAILTGRCTGGAAKVRLTGRLLDTTIDARNTPGNDALAAVWARAKLSSLKSREEITALALRHNLVSEWTSFVTVDAMEKKK